MKKKVIFIGILICIVTFTIVFIQKRNINKLDNTIIKNMFLYHSDKVVEMKENNDQCDEIEGVILNLLNNVDAFDDTIDGQKILEGYGQPMSSDMEDYLIEVNFVKTVDMNLANKKVLDIGSIFISLEEECIYLYQGIRKSQDTSFIAYRCNSSEIEKLSLSVKKQF